MKYILSLTAFMCLSFSAYAQWYFETGINDSKFTQYANKGGNPTGFDSYSGLRDISYALGYLFPFRNLDERTSEEYKPPLVQIGTGIGFDQMSLKTNASIRGAVYPVDYDMAQVHGKLGIYFMPTIIKTKRDTGFRSPLVQLHLSSMLTYNFYTSAVQSITSRTSDLREYGPFDKNYPAYSMGAGFNVNLNRGVRLYIKYEAENTFGLGEQKGYAKQEDYSVFKRKILVGLLVDFKLKNRLRDLERKHFAELEVKLGAYQTQHFKSIYEKLKILEKRVDIVETNDFNHKLIEKDLVQHEKGFEYFQNFRNIFFRKDSFKLDTDNYHGQLSSISDYLKNNPEILLKLVGYADSKTGDAHYNLELSKKRAAVVRDYLLKLGVESYRIEAIGAGETLRFSTNDLPENRRTEILIVRN